jgi:hypothetical protein
VRPCQAGGPCVALVNPLLTGVLLPQPGHPGPLILAQRAVPVPAAAPVRVHPVPQGAFVDPQVPGHLRDRAAGLPDQPHRASLKSRSNFLRVSAIAPVLPLGDVSTVGGETQHHVWGANYERLVTAKRRYDPDNIFRLNQNIDPAPSHLPDLHQRHRHVARGSD